MTSLKKERNTLNFFQNVIPREEAESLLSGKAGHRKREGFTTFSAIINGPDGPFKVYSCGKELHENVIKYGNPIPRVGKDQMDDIIKIAEKISKIKEIKHREYFFLVVNTDSCYQKYIRDKISILGYYENNTFIFSHDDPQLRKDGTLEDLIEEPGDAWEIFKENESVVIQGDVQPITYILENGNYHYITDILKRYREIISNDFGIRPTDLQAFLFFLADQESYEKLEDFIEKVGNEDKRKVLNIIKENFYYLKNNIDQHVLNRDSTLTIEFKEGLDKKTLDFLKFKEDLPVKWRKFFGELIRYYNTNKHKDVDDIMRELAMTKKSLILLTTICSKFNTEYHTLVKK